MWPLGNQPGSFARAVGALNYAAFFLRLLVPVSVPSKAGSPQSGNATQQVACSHTLQVCGDAAAGVRVPHYLHL